MKKSALELKNRLASAAPLLTEQVSVFSVAVGVYIANHVLELPTTKIENEDVFFDTQNRVNVNRYLSLMNESILLNFDLGVEVARAFWKVRFNAAFPCGCTGSEGSFFDRLYNTRFVLSDHLNDLIERNSVGIIKLLPAIGNFFEEHKKD